MITTKAFVDRVIECAVRQTRAAGFSGRIVLEPHELRAIVSDNLGGLLGDVERERRWMGQYGQHARDAIQAGQEPKPYSLFVETAALSHHSTPGQACDAIVIGAIATTC
jgi:hypothetical protein